MESFNLQFLTILSCNRNKIKSLAPLKKGNLLRLSIAANFIQELSDISQNTDLKSLGPLLLKPPEEFYFNSTFLPTPEIKKAMQFWLKDPKYKNHSHQCQFILDYRLNKKDNYLKRSQEFNGHHYLFVPILLKWPAAQKFCHKINAHLVTINSKIEKDFIQGLNYLQNKPWTGLYIKNNLLKSVSKKISIYENKFSDKRPSSGYFYFNSKNGTLEMEEVWPIKNFGSDRPFIIEWD